MKLVPIFARKNKKTLFLSQFCHIEADFKKIKIEFEVPTQFLDLPQQIATDLIKIGFPEN